MGFFFFLLVNATLFVRPMEIIPDLEGVKLYEMFILASLVLSLPEIFSYFSTRPLRDQPITICVIGLLVLTVVAQISDPGEMVRHGEYFAKIFVYYLLAVSLLNTATRMRVFIAWLLCCFVLLTSLTILQYHEVIQLTPGGDERGAPNKLLELEKDKLTGEVVTFGRLQGTGIFSDPNEFCGILATALPLCFWALGSRSWALRPLWLLLIGLCLYGIALTRSRGGFLGLVAGLGVMAAARVGWKNTLLLGALGLPVLFFAFGGRQTELSATEGTARTRVQLWSEWLMRFRENPLTGGGLNLAREEDLQLGKTADELGHLAHNSYLQAFADWGFLGGTLFLGAFVFAFWGVGRFQRGRVLILDARLRRLQPYLLGSLAAYAASIFSLSMTDRVPSYFMLALGCMFPLIARSVPPIGPVRVTPRVVLGIFGLSLAMVAFLYVFVRLFVTW
ncbi:MAG: O-antigen ligase family protein [Gemmataceae bacterium]